MSTLQIYITGFKLVQSVLSDKVKVYFNGADIEVRVNGSFSLNTNTQDQLHGQINSDYAPPINIVNNCRTNNQVHLSLMIDGRLITNNFTQNSSLSLWTIFRYAKK